MLQWHKTTIIVILHLAIYIIVCSIIHLPVIPSPIMNEVIHKAGPYDKDGDFCWISWRTGIYICSVCHT